MPLLVISEPGSGERRVPVSADRTLIGRGERCDVVLRDGRVSREHAMLHARRPLGSWSLQDLGSENGIHVNGRRESEVTLADGDRIRLGKTEIIFHEHAEDGGRGTQEPARDDRLDAVDSPTMLETGMQGADRGDTRKRLRELDLKLNEQESLAVELARRNTELQQLLNTLCPPATTGLRGPVRFPLSGGGEVALAPPGSAVHLELAPSAPHWHAAARFLGFEGPSPEHAPRLVTDIEALGAADRTGRLLYAEAEDQARALDVLGAWEWVLRCMPHERVKPLLTVEGAVGLGLAAGEGEERSLASDMLTLAMSKGWTGGRLDPAHGRVTALFLAIGNGTSGGERAISSLQRSFATVARDLLDGPQATVSCTRFAGEGIRLAFLRGGLSPS